MDIKTFTEICRNAHEMNYALSGEGYASLDEMQFHRTDPLAMFELVRAYVVSLTGYDWCRYGEIVKCDSAEIEEARNEVLKSFRYILSK